MNKLLISFIIAYIVVTGVILVAKPQLHKPVAFSPSQAVIENLPEKYIEEEPKIVHVQQYEETETENIKFKPQPERFEQQQIKTKNVQPQYVEKNIKTVQAKPQTQQQSVKFKNQPEQTQTTQKPKYELPKSVMDIVNNTAPKNEETEKIVKTETPKPQEQEKPKVEHPPVQQKPVQVQSNAPLTEAEEVIVWNKWRSDLQNKVMRDSTIAAPRGTVFRFSFTVNKFGQISNLKIWSDTPSYTNYAIQSLKPLLLSYQGQPILNFPARTKRITTNVVGGFVVSNQDRYTTPKDYSDIERVRQ